MVFSRKEIRQAVEREESLLSADSTNCRSFSGERVSGTAVKTTKTAKTTKTTKRTKTTKKHHRRHTTKRHHKCTSETTKTTKTTKCRKTTKTTGQKKRTTAKCFFRRVRVSITITIPVRCHRRRAKKTTTCRTSKGRTSRKTD